MMWPPPWKCDCFDYDEGEDAPHEMIAGCLEYQADNSSGNPSNHRLMEQAAAHLRDKEGREARVLVEKLLGEEALALTAEEIAAKLHETNWYKRRLPKQKAQP